MTPRKILVTSALPYANGSIHIGHLVEYIQTDIWVRFQKMQGHETHYVCADDTHGTPIMLRAEKEGISPEALIARVHGEHLRDFTGFHVAFDHYGSTHSDATRDYAETIYRSLRDAGLIAKKSVEQYYDPLKEMFLPDRFIKGECPKCGAKDQYGDNCEVCGAAYVPTDLKNPYSAVSGAAPVRRASEHYFFKLSDARCADFLRAWTTSGTLQAEAANKMKEWLGNAAPATPPPSPQPSPASGRGGNRRDALASVAQSHTLSDWDISRDAPYFGFEIPDAPGKFFYVWLDAPVGYMGSFRELCRSKNIDFDAYWKEGATTELHHFIGKDILYFHALFWPAMLKNAGYRTPTGIYAHGFLTVNGEKMSKSRGTFITAESYLQQGMNPEWLRYYYAAKLNDTMEDIDLNFDDFVARVNSDLIGKYVNIASRCAGFIAKRFSGRLAVSVFADEIAAEFAAAPAAIAAHYQAREYSKAMREIMRLADLANQYVDAHKPWEIAKSPERSAELHTVCSTALALFRELTLLLKPVLPEVARHAEAMLNIAPLQWAQSWQHLPAGHAINPYQHLMARVDPKQIAALVAANR